MQTPTTTTRTQTFTTTTGPVTITAADNGTALLEGSPEAIAEILADFPGRDWSTLATFDGGVILDERAAREIAPNVRLQSDADLVAMATSGNEDGTADEGFDALVNRHGYYHAMTLCGMASEPQRYASPEA